MNTLSLEHFVLCQNSNKYVLVIEFHLKLNLFFFTYKQSDGRKLISVTKENGTDSGNEAKSYLKRAILVLRCIETCTALLE